MVKGKMRRNRKNASANPQAPKINIPTAAVTYRGPYRLPQALPQTNVLTVEKNLFFNLFSDVGGTIALVQGSSPAAIGDWTSLANSFEEYRTLAFEIEYRPANRYSKVTTATFPSCWIVDRSSASALGSSITAANHASCRLLSLEDPFKIGCKMTGTDESDFIPTSAPISVSWIKAYVTGLTASTTYGSCLVKYVIQLRGEA